METKLFNQKGEKVGILNLPENIFGLTYNPDLVHQVAVSMQANKRVKVAHVKDRSEVSGSGKKPWRQKGTGRARHGSVRSPIWIGGGVAHGPNKEKDYSKKINKKMKKLAFNTALSQKFKDREIFFLDDVKLENKKTKEALEIIKNLSNIEGLEKIKSKKKNRVIFAFNKKDKNIERSFRNIPGVLVKEKNNLNLLDILSYKYIIFVNFKN